MLAEVPLALPGLSLPLELEFLKARTPALTLYRGVTLWVSLTAHTMQEVGLEKNCWGLSHPLPGGACWSQSRVVLGKLVPIPHTPKVCSS